MNDKDTNLSSKISNLLKLKKIESLDSIVPTTYVIENFDYNTHSEASLSGTINDIKMKCGELPWIIRSAGYEDLSNTTNAGCYESEVIYDEDEFLNVVKRVTTSSQEQLSIKQREILQIEQDLEVPINFFIQPFISSTHINEFEIYAPYFSHDMIELVKNYLYSIHYTLGYKNIDTEWVFKSDKYGVISSTCFSTFKEDVIIFQMNFSFGNFNSQKVEYINSTILVLDDVKLWKKNHMQCVDDVNECYLVQAREISDLPFLRKNIEIVNREELNVKKVISINDIIIPSASIACGKVLASKNLNSAWSQYISLSEEERNEIKCIVVERGSANEHAGIMFLECKLPAVISDVSKFENQFRYIIDQSNQEMLLIENCNTKIKTSNSNEAIFLSADLCVMVKDESSLVGLKKSKILSDRQIEEIFRNSFHVDYNSLIFKDTSCYSATAVGQNIFESFEEESLNDVDNIYVSISDFEGELSYTNFCCALLEFYYNRKYCKYLSNENNSKAILKSHIILKLNHRINQAKFLDDDEKIYKEFHNFIDTASMEQLVKLYKVISAKTLSIQLEKDLLFDDYFEYVITYSYVNDNFYTTNDDWERFRKITHKLFSQQEISCSEVLYFKLVELYDSKAKEYSIAFANDKSDRSYNQYADFLNLWIEAFHENDFIDNEISQILKKVIESDLQRDMVVNTDAIKEKLLDLKEGNTSRFTNLHTVHNFLHQFFLMRSEQTNLKDNDFPLINYFLDFSNKKGLYHNKVLNLEDSKVEIEQISVMHKSSIALSYENVYAELNEPPDAGDDEYGRLIAINRFIKVLNSWYDFVYFDSIIFKQLGTWTVSISATPTLSEFNDEQLKLIYEIFSFIFDSTLDFGYQENNTIINENDFLVDKAWKDIFENVLSYMRNYEGSTKNIYTFAISTIFSELSIDKELNKKVLEVFTEDNSSKLEKILYDIDRILNTEDDFEKWSQSFKCISYLSVICYNKRDFEAQVSNYNILSSIFRYNKVKECLRNESVEHRFTMTYISNYLKKCILDETGLEYSISTFADNCTEKEIASIRNRFESFIGRSLEDVLALLR